MQLLAFIKGYAIAKLKEAFGKGSVAFAKSLCTPLAGVI
jgi:hypothetical protein